MGGLKAGALRAPPKTHRAKAGGGTFQSQKRQRFSPNSPPPPPHAALFQKLLPICNLGREPRSGWNKCTRLPGPHPRPGYSLCSHPSVTPARRSFPGKNQKIRPTKQPDPPCPRARPARASWEQEPGEDAEVALPPRLDLLAGAGLLQITHPRARTTPTPTLHADGCTRHWQTGHSPEKTGRANL